MFLGAIGHPDVKPGILEVGILLKTRFALDQYINLRPVKLYPNVETPLKDKGPEHIDFVVVRENTGGIYTGIGGVTHKGTPLESTVQVMTYSRPVVERCVKYAYELTRKRGSKKKMLTLVHKCNVLTHAGDLWVRVHKELGDKFYPEIKQDYNHVDACTMWFVKQPEYYDVIVTENLFGDIITDLAAIIQGGLGIAAGGNINPEGVSMFEPMGGRVGRAVVVPASK
jgi:3-isopropylmalate dehydrogenase